MCDRGCDCVERTHSLFTFIRIHIWPVSDASCLYVCLPVSGDITHAWQQVTFHHYHVGLGLE